MSRARAQHPHFVPGSAPSLCGVPAPEHKFWRSNCPGTTRRRYYTPHSTILTNDRCHRWARRDRPQKVLFHSAKQRDSTVWTQAPGCWSRAGRALTFRRAPHKSSASDPASPGLLRRSIPSRQESELRLPATLRCSPGCALQVLSGLYRDRLSFCYDVVGWCLLALRDFLKATWSEAAPSHVECYSSSEGYAYSSGGSREHSHESLQKHRIWFFLAQ